MSKQENQGATSVVGATQASLASRRESPPTEAFSKRFADYAAAAGAAGVGFLALAQPAQADIVYTPAHIKLTQGALDLDLNHDGRVDFELVDYIHTRPYGTHALSLRRGVNSQKAGVISNASPAALEAGYKIGPGDKFFFGSGLLAFFSLYLSEENGQWLNVDHRFLGLVFTIDGQVHYGWAELSVKTVFGKPIIAVLEGYAYESDPDQPILAGQTGKETAESDSTSSGQAENGALPTALGPVNKDAPGPVSKLGTLGLLALGSLGLGFWQRRKIVAGSE